MAPDETTGKTDPASATTRAITVIDGSFGARGFPTRWQRLMLYLLFLMLVFVVDVTRTRHA
jgi:hypothetical protein